MFCNKCGAKLEDNAKFCPNCGEKITIGNISEEKDAHTKEKRSISPIKICIIVVVCVCILWWLVSTIPKVAHQMSVQQEQKKTEKTIENAFDSITDIKDFVCHIEATAQLYTTANGSQVNDGITVQSDTTFKGNKVHAENGRYYELMFTQTDIGHIEDFPFEFYVSENNLAYAKKDEGSFETVNVDFSRDDMLEFFDEVIENYNEEPQYSSGDEAGTIKISGILSDGTEVYNTYIKYLTLGYAEPENSPISSTMNYNVIISKESETVQSITFYLSDVEHIWLGWGSDGLQVDNAYGELTIEFWAYEDIADFDLPSVVAYKSFNTDEYIDPTASMSEEEKNAYVVKSEVLPAYENYANNYVSDYSFSFIYLDDDEIPELVLHGDCEAAGNIICTYYNGSVVELNTQRLSFDYLEKQGLLCNSTGNMGYYFDNIFNLKDGEFTNVVSGEYWETYDDNGNIVTDANGIIVFSYSWNGQQVTADEYDELLAQAFNKEDATSVYDLEFYSSVVEAYDNIVL